MARREEEGVGGGSISDPTPSFTLGEASFSWLLGGEVRKSVFVTIF